MNLQEKLNQIEKKYSDKNYKTENKVDKFDVERAERLKGLSSVNDKIEGLNWERITDNGRLSCD